MSINANFDVVVVGAGPAGITAAICLARADFSVLVLEAGAFPGAENWSGAVYFTETLTRPDVLGLEEIERGAIERRVVKRGFYLYNGHAMFGLSYRNPGTFDNCYTVLRPVFDHWLAEKAKRFGVTILNETTAESLVRSDSKIIGVNTDRGPVYADAVFLAEGDASHLVTKEGYERLPGAALGERGLHRGETARPAFLQGIKEVVELDPSRIEKNFGVRPGEAACYEIALRNGSIGNRPAQLNAGGFLYTNQQSVSLGIVLPLDNLAHHFNGDHNRLMEWFKALPEIQRWVGGGQAVAYGAKIIRSGGIKALPQLVDDGLAIGGAASGIGIDFPYPNFTGPACAMGYLFAEALKKIRAEGQPVSKANLEQFYERPLRRTHYFKNVEFLRHWPGYVENTTFFFGRQVDLVCGSLYALSHPKLGAFGRWWQLAKFVRETLPLKRWGETFADLRTLNRAIPLLALSRRAFPSAFGSWLLNTIWPFRRQLPLSTSYPPLELSFSVEAQPVVWVRFPWIIRRLARALRFGLPDAAHSLYHNDDTPIEKKLQRSLGLVIRNANLWDFLLWFALKLTVVLLMPLQWLCEMVRYALRRPTVEEYLTTFYQRWLATTRKVTKLDDGGVKIAQPWEDKLGTISYLSEKTSHIKVFRPALFEKRDEIPKSPLWHICPAKVYECRTDDLGQSQIVVNWENCVKCESCWRGSDDADWSRHRAHRLVYRTYTPAEKMVLELMENNEWGSGRVGDTAIVGGVPRTPTHPASAIPPPVSALLQKLALKIREFSITLHREPRDLDRNRVLWLQAIIAQELEIAKEIGTRHSALGIPNWPDLNRLLESRAHHASLGRFFWAETDGQQLLAHHLGQLGVTVDARPLTDLPAQPDRPALRRQIETGFPRQSVKALDHDAGFSVEQLALLKKLAAFAARGVLSRRLVLEELGRVEPAAALLLSHHLIGCELLGRSPDGEWLAVARFEGKKALLVPSALAKEFVSIGDGALAVIHQNDVAVHRQQTSGLTAARLAHLTLRSTPANVVEKPGRRALVAGLAANDLLSIALGASTMLVERATAHALTRVQFPGLFKDENGRDGVGKFGAVKKLLSEMEADRHILETLAYFPHSLTPEELKLVTAEAFGTMPGSVTYNAGQIVGGPAFSEDDIYSKFYRDSGAWSGLWWNDAAEHLDNFAASSLPALLPKVLPLIEERNRRRRDAGIPSEKENEIEKLLHDVAALLRSAGDAGDSRLTEARRQLGEAILRDGYFDQPLQSPIPFTYESLLQADLGYHYGDFLVQPGELAAPRYLPEQLHLDPELRAFNDRVREYFRLSFAERTAEGLPYARFIEKHHKVPEADVFALIDHGFLRMTIPRELGGEGLSKAHYYVLITNAMRYGEPGVSLTIQANTSIGTTPILIGLKQDLPRARKDLEDFLGDLKNSVTRVTGYFKSSDAGLPPAIRDIGREIDRILGMLHTPAVLKVKEAFIALGEKVKADIGRRPMLRAIASDFLNSFLQAARAGQRQDLKTFESNLKRARECMPRFRGRAEAVLAELDRRAEAHRFFLRLISSGQIAAFALTEPGAGSDSAGVQTRATLRQAEVFTDSDGVKFFHLDPEATQRRNLVDAARVRFEGRRVLYAIADDAPPVELHWPGPGEGLAKPRWFEWKGRRIEFFDIGQIRSGNAGERNCGTSDGMAVPSKTPDPGGECFTFYELNGAKMWITNAHIAGVFALYAKTPEGVTGFMVDRFAEGMSVGQDEEKMGQRGSPTNELGLGSVRVPRECVMGIEGRGQVNALETLNVGRAGLCVSTVAMMLKIVEQTRAFVNGSGFRLQASGFNREQHRLLGAMVEELYATESIAYELIGLFDHPGTESVRMESAIGKYYGSEALHRIIRWAEAIHGCHSQTAEYEIEKHRRDARVLTIYEGTNEVQRFLMLKDLAQEVFPRWTDASFVGEAHPKLGAEAQLLKQRKELLKERIGEVVQVFGPQIWQNPGFQPAFFILADLTGFVKVMESVLRRTQWLLANIADNSPAEDVRHRDRALTTTVNYFARVGGEIQALDATLQKEFGLLKQGIYPPSIRVATLRCEEQEHPDAAAALRSPESVVSESAPHRSAATLKIVVLLKPVPLLSPRPHVGNGELWESHFEINPFDRATLLEALRLKGITGGRPSQTASHVHVTVISAAPAYARELLRQTLAMGADEAVWIDMAANQWNATQVSRLLADAVRETGPQLVFAGCRATDAAPGVVGALVADDLSIACVQRVTALRIENGEQGQVAFDLELEQFPGVTVTKKSPVLLTWATAAPRPVRGALDHFTMEGWLHSFEKPLRTLKPPAFLVQGTFLLRLPPAPGVAAEDEGPRTPEGAAKLLARAAGLELGGGGHEKEIFRGEIARRTPSEMKWRDCVVFLAEPPAERFSLAALQSLDVAVGLAGHLKLPLRALVFTQADDARLRTLASGLAAHHAGEIVFVSGPNWEGAPEEAYLEAMRKLWNAENHPDYVIGPTWARGLLARFANCADGGDRRLHVHGNIKEIVVRDGSLELVSPAFGGKVEAVQSEPSKRTEEKFITLAAGAVLHTEASRERTGERANGRTGETTTVMVVELAPSHDLSADEMVRLFKEATRATGAGSVKDAEFVIDVGYAIANKENYGVIIDPLAKVLKELGVKGVQIGGSRKVVEELKLLRADQQIGQTGVNVNPTVLLAIGISGAPQHLDYIGEKATILAFNKDPHAPIMTLNQRRARPRVYPIVGDLFKTVPQFMEALKGLKG